MDNRNQNREVHAVPQDDAALSKQKEVTLGLHQLETTNYLFVGQELLNNVKCPWYTLEDGGSKLIVKQNAITGLLEKIELVEVKVKAGNKVENKIKLDTTIRAGEEKFVVRTGYDTTFAKGLVLRLARLSAADLQRLITIKATPALESDKVVFANVLQDDESIRLEDGTWAKEFDIAAEVEAINDKLAEFVTK